MLLFFLSLLDVVEVANRLSKFRYFLRHLFHETYPSLLPSRRSSRPYVRDDDHIFLLLKYREPAGVYAVDEKSLVPFLCIFHLLCLSRPPLQHLSSFLCAESTTLLFRVSRSNGLRLFLVRAPKGKISLPSPPNSKGSALARLPFFTPTPPSQRATR